jgi:hypothetical protein
VALKFSGVTDDTTVGLTPTTEEPNPPKVVPALLARR